MKVSILGVLVGGVVDVVTSVLGAVSAAIHGNLPLYSAQLAVGLICSILGGYVAAAIAKRHERLNGTLSCYLCVGMGIVAMSLGLERDPRWIQFLMLAASPALAFVGGDLRLRRRLSNHTR